MSKLNIIVYHYVRDLSKSRYPDIKARHLSEFRTQLEFIGKHFTVVSVEQIVAAIKGASPLPPNAAWLTFDDGYLEHYTNVFPLLQARGWQGSFFPPANAILNGELLDVNKIHFILASQPNTQLIIDEIRHFVEKLRMEEMMMSFEQYWQDLAHPWRYDPAEVVFIKRMLQRDLPETARNELTRHLFQRFIAIDPAAFANELYMSADQLKTMIRCGMYVGSHGAKHYWLDRLSPAQQAAEIDASLDFLKGLGAPTEDWVMCYPYGAYNSHTLELLKEKSCAVGVTTKVAVAQIGADRPLELPRLDTNDLQSRIFSQPVAQETDEAQDLGRLY
jgi:peptidoglycan/xylan/chitin deacetylase (PgdA/CDA1 family)